MQMLLLGRLPFSLTVQSGIISFNMLFGLKASFTRWFQSAGWWVEGNMRQKAIAYGSGKWLRLGHW